MESNFSLANQKIQPKELTAGIDICGLLILIRINKHLSLCCLDFPVYTVGIKMGPMSKVLK